MPQLYDDSIITQPIASPLKPYNPGTPEMSKTWRALQRIQTTALTEMLCSAHRLTAAHPCWCVPQLLRPAGTEWRAGWDRAEKK